MVQEFKDGPYVLELKFKSEDRAIPYANVVYIAVSETHLRFDTSDGYVEFAYNGSIDSVAFYKQRGRL